MPFTLNDVTFDLDPEDYQPLEVIRRGSVLPLVDGGTLIQDRGFKVTDGLIKLGGKIADLDVLKSLVGLEMARGTSYVFTDDKDCSYTVCFSPRQGFIWKPIHGSNLGFTYSMVLCVISVDRWFGADGGFPVET